MKKQLLFFLFMFSALLTACAPTAMPTVTVPDPRAVGAVETFYQLTNNAQTETDLKEAWNMLSDNVQCNSQYKCQYQTFQKLWWQWKTDYKLYDCGDNQVYAAVVRYPGEGNPSTDPAKEQSWMFGVIEMENGMMIGSTSLTQSTGDGCVLLSEGSAPP